MRPSEAWIKVTGPAKVTTPAGLTYYLGGTTKVSVPPGSKVELIR